MIQINNTKAIEITKEKIREFRSKKLPELDIEFQIALERNLDTSEIVAKKQELRDMPTIADGKTTEKLKEILDSLEE